MVAPCHAQTGGGQKVVTVGRALDSRAENRQALPADPRIILTLCAIILTFMRIILTFRGIILTPLRIMITPRTVILTNRPVDPSGSPRFRRDERSVVVDGENHSKPAWHFQELWFPQAQVGHPDGGPGVVDTPPPRAWENGGHAWGVQGSWGQVGGP